MEDRKLNELDEEKLDAVFGGSKQSSGKKLDFNRMAEGPDKYCDHCGKYVTSKLAYNQKTYCPLCGNEI